jgi:hypothetical protein
MCVVMLTRCCLLVYRVLSLSLYQGQVDGNGVLRGVFKQNVTPFMSVTFSGSADLPQDQYKFGIGLSIEIQELATGTAKALEAQEKTFLEAQQQTSLSASSRMSQVAAAVLPPGFG